MARKVESAAQEAAIVDLTQDGRGVARLNGKAVFVAGALPGERVRLRVIRHRSSHDEAVLDEILAASPDRVAPRCLHFGICGGCSLQHLDAAAQVAAKQSQLLETLVRVGNVKPARILAPITGPSWSYRRRARIGVKFVRKKGRVLAGFREREKPYVTDVVRCEVLRTPHENLPGELAALVDGMTLREHIPQVEFSAGDAECALIFRIMQPAGAEDLERLRRFAAQNRVQIYLQPGGLETIQPLPAADGVGGAGGAGDLPPLDYRLEDFGVSIGFEPAGFVQVNGTVNSAMVHQAVDQLDLRPSDRVLDLFCGLGNFSLPLARRAAQVTGVEGDAGLIDGARRNAARNAIGNVEFHVANLFEPKGFGAWADGPYQALLIDPPRAGAREIVENLVRWAPRRVVYISCHPGSLARDAGILVHTQGYELIAAGVMDMFPHTTHIEAIAVFERHV